jgi:uncharacterized protein YecT (DUF1311 family)
MYHLAKLFILTIALLVSGAAIAGNCAKIQRDDLLQDCLAKELATFDKELNATYTKLRGVMEKDTKNMLTKAQRIWLTLRDADCEFEAESHKIGTGYHAIYLNCQITKTQQRIKEFKESSFWPHH